MNSTNSLPAPKSALSAWMQAAKVGESIILPLKVAAEVMQAGKVRTTQRAPAGERNAIVQAGRNGRKCRTERCALLTGAFESPTASAYFILTITE